MKLIVLYGPKDSGKTTTLKMVYDVLKKINVLETNQFDYIDKEKNGITSLRNVDVKRHDFLDILFVDRQRLNTIHSNNFNNLNNYNFFECNSENIQEVIIKVEKKITEYKQKTQEDIYSIIDNSIELPLVYENKEIQSCNIKQILPQNLKYVGITTHGDYGFNCKPSAPNLYALLDKLKGCDTIICACSQNLQDPPFNCVTKFVQDNTARISQIIIVLAWFGQGANKFTKTPLEKLRANIILHNI